jgi:vacuolar-type H+-ATPase subunit H
VSSLNDNRFSELGDAARRAGELFTHHVDQIAADAERRAQEIREKGELEAEATRREALESGRRVFERINALERPLGELVRSLRDEMDRVTAELGERRYSELPSPSIAAEPEPEPAPASTVEPEPAARAMEPTRIEPEERIPEPQPTPEPEPEPALEPEVPAAGGNGAAELTEEDIAHEVAERAPARPAPTVSSPVRAEPAVGRLRRRSLRRRPRSQPFVDSAGECAVCQRSFKAGSEAELAASGWAVSGEVGLCPSCQEDGWQLPEGARLPFRRGAS